MNLRTSGLSFVSATPGIEWMPFHFGGWLGGTHDRQRFLDRPCALCRLRQFRRRDWHTPACSYSVAEAIESGKRLVSILYSYEINNAPHFRYRNGTIDGSKR